MALFTNWALKRSAVTVLITIALLGFGLFAVTQLKSELTPNITIPVVYISTTYPGASPNDITEQVSKPIEATLGSLPHVTSLQSTSADGLSYIVLQLDYGTDLKDTIATINQDLRNVQFPIGPTGQAVQPVVSTLDFGQQPVFQASLVGKANQSSSELEQTARTVILPELSSLAGVGSVTIVGGTTNQVNVSFDLAKLQAAGISIQQVQAILTQNNITLPAGSIVQNGQSLPIRTTGSLTTLDQLSNLAIGAKGQFGAGTGPGASTTGAGASSTPTTPSTQPTSTAQTGQPQTIYLKDVASVTYGPTVASSISRTNGKTSVTIQVIKTQEGNTASVGGLVNSKLDDLRKTIGSNFEIITSEDQSISVNESIDGLVREGLIGAVFAILIIFLFLRNVRSTLVTAVSIPTSVLIAFILMWWQGITLNIITLSGLAIAIGRVVDDAIVVLENIFRHVSMGEPVPVAVRRGTREVATAITSSTIATVCVFVPLGLVGGITTQFFLPLALTISFALVASLFVALTIIPVLAQIFISRNLSTKMAAQEHKISLLQRIYIPILRWSLHNRLKVVLLAVVFFIGSLTVIPLLPVAFLPSDQAEKLLSITTAYAPGTDKSVVDNDAQKIEAVLVNYPQTKSFLTTIGGTNQRQQAAGIRSGGATIQLNLKDDANLDTATAEVKNLLKPLTPQNGSLNIASGNFGSSSNSLTLILDGNDQDSVRKASDQVLAALQSMTTLKNLRSDVSALVPQITISVDANKAQQVGQTAAGVAASLRAYVQGQTVTQVRLDQSNAQPVNLVFSFPASTAGDIEKIKALTFGINSQTRQPVTLGEIATVTQEQGPTQVTRISQKPAATISADITDQNTGGVSADVTARVKALSLPAGISYYLGGQQQQQASAFGGLFIAFGVAILLVYATLVLIFGSLSDPFIILLSLPLAFIGAFPALLITGRAIGLPALMGILMLIGLVVTNAIVLIDRVIQLRKEGYSKNEALMRAGENRLRPILMTALATILALMPLAVGLAKGSIIGAELATVVIGGLFTSTILTLVVIPCVYSLVHGLTDRLKGNRLSASEEVVAWEAEQALKVHQTEKEAPVQGDLIGAASPKP